MHDHRAEFDRCWPRIEASIEAYGHTHTKDDIWRLIDTSAFDTVERLKNLQVEQRDDSDDALARWDAMRPKPEPVKREPGLDTNLPALIEAKVAAAISAERERTGEISGGANRLRASGHGSVPERRYGGVPRRLG